MSDHEIATLSDQVVKHFRYLETATLSNRVQEVETKNLSQYLRLFNKAIRYGTMPLGLKTKIQTNAGHLRRLQILLKKKPAVGGNLSGGARSNRVRWEDLISSFKGRVRTGVIINLKHIDTNAFLGDAFKLFKTRINKILKKFTIIKVNTTFCGDFIKKSDEEELIDFKYFSTRNVTIDNGTELEGWFKENVVDKILNKLSEYQEKDSGWALYKIISLEVNINQIEQGNGGSSYIGLPDEILRKKACVNVINLTDKSCFLWSIIAALYPIKNNPNRLGNYPHYSTILKTEGLEMPMTLKGINKFEKLNNISVNVYILELRQLGEKASFFTVPARLTQNKLEKHVNLLLIQNEYTPKLNDYEMEAELENNIDIRYHYVWIKDLSRLISSQLNKHKSKSFICDRCLNYFLSQEKLEEHAGVCRNVNNCKISFPSYSHVEFKNFAHKEKVPFTIYADFESVLEPYLDNKTHPSVKSTKYQHHKAFSAGFYLKCSYDDSLSFFDMYLGEDCMDWFSTKMAEIAQLIQSKIKTITPMSEGISRNGAKLCHICEKSFAEKDIVVRDHNHFTGDFRGFAHQACNLNYQKSFVVPIVFHNLSGYDSHFIIKDIAKKGRVTLLPINKEKYISFTQHDNETDIKFRFIDSMRFLGASLDELSSSLISSDMKILRKEFRNSSDDQFKLLTRKGIFCYDYVDSVNKLKEPSLPTIDKFYNKLNNSNVSKEDYQHATNIWQKFNIKNLGEYSMLYLKTDILLLADVFEKFRSTSLTTYGLDPAFYYTMPGYTWDCMLKYTKCKLELLKDVDKLMFIEAGIRGGVSQACNRFSEANNKYMANYDASKPSKYLLYLDANNLYACAMAESLPYGGFEWVDSSDIQNISEIPDDAPEGYILKVDLEYPRHLHDLHKDLPFCPEHIAPPNSKLKKLMTTLHDKKGYIIHYRNLKQALKHGLILKKIHKVLKFKQSPWLKPYVDFNTNLRKNATTNFEKNMFKLMNNAVFGKTMENLRKHRTVRLVNKWEGRYGAKNMLSSPQFHSRTIFEEDLLAIEMSKTDIVFNKPLYIGMAILDISKTVMYAFHYDYMLKKFPPGSVKLLYTDTDSLIYEITCNDVYEEVIKADPHMFDTSDYPPNNRYNIPLLNKKVIGLMKDEANGRIITNYIGLRSKMYTFLIEGLKCVKKSKGVKYSVVAQDITFEDYLECLERKQTKCAKQRTIQSHRHNVYSVDQEKIALSWQDDKRYLLPNSHDTLPWGHYSIMDVD